jgi:DNA-directed RNA polymerase specialized sigma54-like protein
MKSPRVKVNSDIMERNTRSKSEQEYVKALIQGLSLQRLTDQEIVDYLRNEKGIEIARTTVNATKNRIERSAEKRTPTI